jgi:hypothetical protein
LKLQQRKSNKESALIYHLKNLRIIITEFCNFDMNL